MSGQNRADIADRRDRNLELDGSVLDSMQRLNAELSYLESTELLSAYGLFNRAHRAGAVRALGRQ